ncbi:MAG TPA: ATP synthase F1 subunit gamma [Ignavibacteria bacterium]|nr:ATP synthase F1 subunit gamma [Ignavibacteria bacterium]HMR39025.1 ATP synthase F1 subunit gamma [Ignavibacteria bacterium]
MATLKELKVRIGGVKGTQKITKAMKMVASAKFRRAQERIITMRPYAHKINELLSQLVEAAGEEAEKIMTQREVKNKLVVVVSADRGLAGSFNTNIIRYASNYINTLGADTKVITVGRKCTDAFKKKDVNVIKTYINIFNDLSLEISNDIVNNIIDGYQKKLYDGVDIVYSKFISVVKQETAMEQFLPIKKTVDLKDNTGIKEKKNTDYIFEPNAIDILKVLIPKQYRIQFWKILLESNAAEQAARMTAMETATKNASDLLSELELSYNQARQAAITKEILEIVGGAEALKDA